jgi:hypothetical protein
MIHKPQSRLKKTQPAQPSRNRIPGVVFAFALQALLLFAACQPEASEQVLPTGAEVAAKRLATVGPTSTLSPQEMQATEAVRRPPTEPPATPTPTATPYVGIFLGEVEFGEFDQLSVDPVHLPVPTRQSIHALFQDCELPPDNVFGTAWTTERSALTGLGCPIQASFGFTGNVQIFERGVMYLNEGSSEVWAILPGSLLDKGRFWYVEQPPSLPPPPDQPPPGLYLPDGPFGIVWSIVPQTREAMGFATTPVQPIGVNIQRFEGGMLFLDVTVGQVFVLLVNGDAYGPF